MINVPSSANKQQVLFKFRIESELNPNQIKNKIKKKDVIFIKELCHIAPVKFQIGLLLEALALHNGTWLFIVLETFP